MTFLHPQLLGLLVIPVILGFWEWVRRGQPIALPFDHGRQRRGLPLRFLILAANCLPAVLLALAILFLAHPTTFTPPEVERKITNAQIVLDTSPSMSAEYGDQTAARATRFDAAMDAITQFTTFRKGDAFGLTIFSRDFIHWLPITFDTQSIALAKPFIVPNNPKLDPKDQPPHGFPVDLWAGTFIGKALLGATDLLAQRPTGDRMIILITDGRSGDILPPKDAEITEKLQANNITVFGILLTDEAIEPALGDIARATGGEVFNALSPESLSTVFQRIDEMKKAVVREKQRQRVDYYDPLFAPAISALVLSLLSLFGLRFTPW